VGDDHEGELGSDEEVFEPLDAFEVEVMVGSSRSRTSGSVTRASAIARRLRQPPLRLAASTIHAGITGGVVFSEAGATQGFAQALLAVGCGNGGAVEGRFGDLANRDAGGEVGELVDVADAGSLTEGDFAGVGLLLGTEDSKKRGFARTVGADEADAVAVVDGKGDVVEERIGAEAFGDVLRDQRSAA